MTPKEEQIHRDLSAAYLLGYLYEQHKKHKKEIEKLKDKNAELKHTLEDAKLSVKLVDQEYRKDAPLRSVLFQVFFAAKAVLFNTTRENLVELENWVKRADEARFTVKESQ